MENNLGSKLPILKHFESSDIGKSVDSFRKGEKGLFNIFKIILFGAILYFSWIYVLPPVFMAIGQFMAIAATGVCIVLGIVMLPVILKGIKRFTRFAHKSLIKHDPFGELEDQKGKMQANKKKFQLSKGKINNLKHEMEVGADESEKKAKLLETKIVAEQAKASKFKSQMEAMVKSEGPSAKGSDLYVDLHSKFLKVVSSASRRGHELQQEKDFVQKYGTRGAIMKKFGQKLTMVETSMDIKILDFDTTIVILKKDYALAQSMRSATDSVRETMTFADGWEVEYALDVVTTTIAQDIARTAGNLQDIDSLTANFSMDSEELYAGLDALANDIKVGKDPVTSAKSYSSPDYVPTHDDKMKSGGFGDVF
jgi:hypothetical protein